MDGVTATFDLTIAGKLIGDADGGALTAQLDPVRETVKLTRGTAAVGKGDVLYRKDHTLAASAVLNLDLAGSLVDAFNNTVAAEEIVIIDIYAAPGNVGNALVGGGSFHGPLGTATYAVKPGEHYYAVAEKGWLVVAGTGDIFRIANGSGDAGINVTVTLMGRTERWPALAINIDFPTAFVGVPYSYSPTVTGGIGSRAFEVTGAPEWLSSNVSGGQITFTGTPTEVGTSIGIGISVTDLSGSVSGSGDLPVSVTIGGVAMGALGTAGTALEGLKLTFGDDFTVLPTSFTNDTRSGKYASSSPHTGARRTRSTSPSSESQIYMDPAWRGRRSQAPAGLGYSPFSVASSILTIAAVQCPNEMLPYLPTDYSLGGGDGGSRPYLYSGRLATWPSFMLNAEKDFAMEARVRFASGQKRGYWPSLWSTALNWPDFQEMDMIEVITNSTTGAVTNQTNVNGSTSDAGANAPTTVGSHLIPDGRWLQTLVRIKRATNTIEFWDDFDVEGTLALAFTYSNSRVSRFRGAHSINLDLAVDTNWDASVFTIANWPKSYNIDWFRVWTAGTREVAAPVDIAGDISTTAGGAWTATLPSVSTLYGETPSREEVYAIFDNPDSPGAPTRANGLPGGMSVNLSTRAVTGTVPTTEGGRVGILLVATFSDGGPAKMARKWFNVAPAVDTLPSSFAVNQNAPIDFTIDPSSFHSGNLGPHTYVVTKTAGATSLTIAGNGTNSVHITGTSSASAETVALQIVCTNAIGQTTTVTRNIAVATVITFSDDFNRANQNLETSPNWTRVDGTAGMATVDGSKLKGVTSDALGAMFLSVDKGASAVGYFAQGKIQDGETISAFDQYGYAGFICIDATDRNNYIGVRSTPGSVATGGGVPAAARVIAVFKRVSGTLTQIAGFAEKAGNGDTLRIERRGSTLAVLLNGTPLTPTSGSLTISAGPTPTQRQGIVVRTNPNLHWLDDYSAGQLTV